MIGAAPFSRQSIEIAKQMNRLNNLVYPATVRAQLNVESKRAFFPLAGTLAATAGARGSAG